MANGTSGGVQYSVVFVNNSTQTGSACVYQQDPDITNAEVMSLAWFAEQAAPTTSIIFTWSIDYDFVWADTGTLAPGVLFVASQTWPANLSDQNQVTFTMAGGPYSFANQQEGPASGNLYITEDGTVPPNAASVGVGMSGFGTFVVQAQPNMNLIFTPQPEYWITFGSYTQGEIMNITEVNNPAQIQFPANVYSMTATLNSDNTWTILPTSQVNAQVVKAGAQQAGLTWSQRTKNLLSAPRG